MSAESDTVKFVCSQCGHQATFPRDQYGQVIYCAGCKTAQVVAETRRVPHSDRAVRKVAAEHTAPPGPAAAPAATGGKIPFTCVSCGHAGRISDKYQGKVIQCPKCNAIQIAGSSGPATVPLDSNGKLPFTCTACGYGARLNPTYAGKAISCPGCQAPQVVPRIAGKYASGLFQVPQQGQAPSTVRVTLAEPMAVSESEPAKPSPAPAPPVTTRPPSEAVARPTSGPIEKPASGPIEKPASGPIEKPTSGPVLKPGSGALDRPAAAEPAPIDKDGKARTEDSLFNNAAVPPPPEKKVVRRRGVSGRMLVPGTDPGTDTVATASETAAPPPTPVESKPAPVPAAKPATDAVRAPEPKPEVKAPAAAPSEPVIAAAKPSRGPLMGVAAVAVVLLLAAGGAVVLWLGAQGEAEKLKGQLDTANRQLASARSEAQDTALRLEKLDARLQVEAKKAEALKEAADKAKADLDAADKARSLAEQERDAALKKVKELEEAAKPKK